MEKESINYNDQTIKIQEKHQLSSSFKVRSYKEKLELMEKEGIKQKPIEEVIEDFFSKKNDIISESTLRSIKNIIYSE